MTTTNKPLTAKRQRFVEAYTALGQKTYGNATQAAIAAGYSPRTAKSQGQRLLTYVDVMAAIEARRDKTAKQMEVSEAYIIDQMVHGLKEAQEKNNLMAQARFLELLAKAKGLFRDSGPTGAVAPEIHVHLPKSYQNIQQQERPNHPTIKLRG